MTRRSRNLWRDTRWRESGWTRARAVLALGMVFGLGSVGTMAYWVDDATVTTGTFSVASLDLRVNDVKSYTSWPLGGTGLMPGDTRAATLIIQNKGNAPFTYTAKANASGDAVLAPYITLTAFAGGTVSSNKCAGGSSLGSTTLQVGTSKNIISDPRPLGVPGNETLCFEARLSDGVVKAASNKTVNAIVEFSATG